MIRAFGLGMNVAYFRQRLKQEIIDVVTVEIISEEETKGERKGRNTSVKCRVVF